MRWWLLVLLAGCKSGAGGPCETWEDCESGKCGGGICVDTDCPCDDGWECVTTDCGIFTCNSACRMRCTETSECPDHQECRERSDETLPHVCVYTPPAFQLVDGGPYSVRNGETLNLRATIDPLPGRWTISSVDFNLVPDDKRIAGPTIEADFAIEGRSQDFDLMVDVYLAEEDSAEPHKQPFYESIHVIVPVTIVP